MRMMPCKRMYANVIMLFFSDARFVLLLLLLLRFFEPRACRQRLFLYLAPSYLSRWVVQRCRCCWTQSGVKCWANAALGQWRTGSPTGGSGIDCKLYIYIYIYTMYMGNRQQQREQRSCRSFLRVFAMRLVLMYLCTHGLGGFCWRWRDGSVDWLVCRPWRLSIMV